MSATGKRSSESPVQRQLRIKLNVCTRLQKDIASYQREVDQQRERISKLAESGADGHDVAKQEQVLGESLAMIQDSQERFGRAVEDLQMFLEENEEELAAGDASELFGEAKAFVGRCGSAE